MYTAYIDIETTEDSFNEGEIGKTCTSLSEYIGKNFKTLKELVVYLKDNYGFPNEYGVYKDTLESSDLVNDDNSKASDTEIEQWKLGKFVLYSARYMVRVYKIDVIDGKELEQLVKEMKQ